MLFLFSFAHAVDIDSFAAPIIEVQRQVASRKWGKAMRLVRHLEGEQKRARGVLLASDIIRLYLFKGYILYKTDKNDAAFTVWRAVAAMSPGFEWELGIPVESEIESIWSMLREEVQSQKEVLVRIPADQTWYINGQTAGENAFVYAGEHFFQRDCGSYVETHWMQVPTSFDWQKTCVGEEKEPNKALSVAVGTGGVALLGAGILSSTLWMNPQWQEIEDARLNPASINRAEADQLTNDFQTARWVSLGLLIGGVALTGTGGGLYFLDDGFRLEYHGSF
ncbi:MAG: hypothetical protein VX278_11670 [Myxococcota bacterium]|nr:hypothetical protein [Myxococcota bacterium]